MSVCADARTSEYFKLKMPKETFRSLLSTNSNIFGQERAQALAILKPVKTCSASVAFAVNVVLFRLFVGICFSHPSLSFNRPQIFVFHSPKAIIGGVPVTCNVGSEIVTVRIVAGPR